MADQTRPIDKPEIEPGSSKRNILLYIVRKPPVLQGVSPYAAIGVAIFEFVLLVHHFKYFCIREFCME